MNIQELKKAQSAVNAKFMRAIKNVKELGLPEADLDQIVGLLDGQYQKQIAALTPSLKSVAPAPAAKAEPALPVVGDATSQPVQNEFI